LQDILKIADKAHDSLAYYLIFLLRIPLWTWTLKIDLNTLL